MKKQILLIIIVTLLQTFTSFAQTQVYSVGAGDVTPGSGASCGNIRYTYQGTSPLHLRWTSTGTGRPVSVSVSLNYAVNCAGIPTNDKVRFNNSYQEAQPTPGPYSCSCSPSVASPTTWNLNPSDYNVGGLNVLDIEAMSSSEGINLLPGYSGVYARITVNYAASTTNQEINVQGNTTSIVNGDSTPKAVDNTEYGVVNTGSTVDHNFTIKNQGVNDLNLASTPITISGSSNFSILSQPASNIIASGSSETFTVRFASSASSCGGGDKNAVVSIASDDADENPYTFAVHATEGVDTTNPVAIAKNITVQLDATGSVTVNADQLDDNSTDNCGINNYKIAPGILGTVCNVVGEENYLVLTAPAGSIFKNIVFASFGNSTGTCGNFVLGSCNAANSLSVVSSALLGQNSATIYSSNSTFGDPCNGTQKRLAVEAAYGPSSSSGTSSITYSCADLGAHDVVLYVTDNNGNVSSVNATITVEDKTLPVIISNGNKTLNVDANTCGATVIVSASATDNCSVGTPIGVRSDAKLLTDLYPLGTTTITWKATDANNNDAVAVTQTVTVIDNEIPVITANGDQNVNVDANTCGATVTVSASATDNCTVGSPIGVRSDAKLLTDLYPVGTTKITWKVTDANSNDAVAVTQTVIVTDNVLPTVITKDITVQLDAAGNATIQTSDIDNNSFDDCGIATLTVSPDTFTCVNVGNNTVILTATDANGNVSSATAIVTIEDKIAPVVATKDIIVQLDATGNASIVASDIDNGSTDACGTPVLTVSPNAFTCANIGANTVTLTATDANGNVSSATAIITIEDKIAPVVATKDIIVQLDATGNVSIVTSDIDNGSTDACGTPVLTVSPSTFTCANVGNNTVTLTGKDANGNVSSATAIVTIEDKIAPVVATKDIIVQLDATGNTSILASEVDNASSDACGTPVLTVSPDTFTCANVGANTVTLTATDANGNVSSATAIVTIEDKIAATVVTKDITVQLDATGNASILASEVDNGSTDACGTPVLTVSPNTFTCVNIGNNNVTLTATDANGNVSSATAKVTIEDKIAPIVVTKDIIVQLDATGNASILASEVDNSSTDSCGTPVLTVSPDTFTCANVGTNTVILTATDANGNVSSATAIVKIEDKTPATVVTKDIIVQLDATGNASILASEVDNGSTDSCGTPTLTVSPDTFTCANVGNNTVTLTATDAKGNVSSATAIVKIEDKTPATVVTKDIIVQLDATGNASILASNVDNGSTDACGTPVLTVSPNTFTCANIGNNTVTLTATDASGNVSSKIAIVTIENKNAPIALAKNSIVQLNATGNATITAADVNNGSTTTCGTPALTISPSTFTCANVGANTVTLTITDANGNVSSATAIVTVQDKIAPVVLVKNATVQLDASGNVSITASQIDNGSSDTCGIASITVTPSNFTCATVGANQVTLKVTDVNGNIATATATVMVEDHILPTAKTRNVSVKLDDAGNASITVNEVNNGSSDNCGIASVSVSKLSFDCTNVGANNVVLTVTDKSGNKATATAIVTVTNTFGDNDNDGILDNCDADDDNDGIADAVDNCPITANPYQEDRNHNGLGDACDKDQMNISEAFTPNGDGINDTWVISNIENYPASVVRVFNRWGAEVFVARNYQNDWDGQSKGNSSTLPAASSYYYQIDLDGNGSIDKQGWIYINR